MCSLGDFMQRPSRVATGSWTAPASLPGRALVRYQSSLNSRGGDFCWPPADTSVGHKRGLSLATTGYFEVAAASGVLRHSNKSSRPHQTIMQYQLNGPCERWRPAALARIGAHRARQETSSVHRMHEFWTA